MVSTPTCGACFGGSGGVLAPGENAITTTNRNFKAGWARATPASTSRTPGSRQRRRGGRDRRTRPTWRVRDEPRGRAIVIRQDNVNTDVLYPGQFLNITDVGQMTQYLFEGLDPSLRNELGGDTALVVGSNFGAGSSREHVPQAMAASGIRFLVGRASARIFLTATAFNLGLPAVIAPEAVDAAAPGSSLRLDLEAALLAVDGSTFPMAPFPRSCARCSPSAASSPGSEGSSSPLTLLPEWDSVGHEWLTS